MKKYFQAYKQVAKQLIPDILKCVDPGLFDHILVLNADLEALRGFFLNLRDIYRTL